MKIAILSAAHSIHTIKIVNGLDSFGHEVLLISQPDHADRDGQYNEGVKIHYLKKSGKKGYFTNARELKRVLKEFSPDVFNAHYASGYGIMAALGRVRPFVLSVWGSDVYEFPYQSFVNKLLVKFNLKRADHIFSTSHCMKKQTEKLVKNKNYTVTPFGVDCEEFCPEKRVAKSSDEPIVFGFVKGLSETYGIEYLIRAYKMLCEKTELDTRLVVYGRGAQEEQMKALANEFGLADRIYFGGFVNHSKVAEILGTVDIFCVPSTAESFGVSAVEAMACGVACVTSDAEGLAEVMEQGKTGIVVEKRNVEALCDAMLTLAENTDLRNEMGKAGRERVLKLYDWNENIKNIEQALTAVANDRK